MAALNEEVGVEEEEEDDEVLEDDDEDDDCTLVRANAASRLARVPV